MESFFTLERLNSQKQQDIRDEVRRYRMAAELGRGSLANRTTLRHRLTTLLLDPFFSSRRRSRSLDVTVKGSMDGRETAALGN